MVLQSVVLDNIAKMASRMYGISFVKSRLMIEQLVKETSDLSESDILKMVGEKMLLYMGGK